MLFKGLFPDEVAINIFSNEYFSDDN